SGLPAAIRQAAIPRSPLRHARPVLGRPLPAELVAGPNGTVRYFPAPGEPGFPFTAVGPLYIGTGASRTQILPVGLGNVGRNTVRGPAEYNVDMSIVRRFRLVGATNVNVRAEAFNLFNHTNFQISPSTT